MVSIMQRITRRQALKTIGMASAMLILSRCKKEPTDASADTVCAVTPSETTGPYPSLTNLIRSDIRESSAGLLLTLTVTVLNANNSCSPVTGAAVEIWQCDAEGHYSQYSQPGYNGQSETFLRGIQTTDSNGRITFTTVYPGWYAGRATHIHVEVSINGVSVKVTQIAFPSDITTAVYATGVYASRGQNPTSNGGDNIFADSLSSELATLTGDTANGYTAAFPVRIAV